MSKSKFYSIKKVNKLSKWLFIISGGRYNGKTQFAYDLLEDLRKHGRSVLIIKKSYARSLKISLKIKASRKRLVRRG